MELNKLKIGQTIKAEEDFFEKLSKPMQDKYMKEHPKSEKKAEAPAAQEKKASSPAAHPAQQKTQSPMLNLASMKIGQTITASPAFNKWLDTFIEEKGIDLEDTFDVQGASGNNHMPYGVVIEHMKIAPSGEQAKLKDMLVKLDFKNADIKHYLRHLAQALAR